MADDLFSVADQVVVVSGASRGIGRELAAGFAARGAQVIITGREAATLEQTAKEISTGKHAVRGIVCDVADVAALDQLVTTLKADYPRIDTLFEGVQDDARDRSGLGFGLIISKRAIEALGGELSARDLPGRGCVFTIDLPRARG